MTLDQLKARAKHNGMVLEKVEIDGMLMAGDFIEWDANAFTKVDPESPLLQLKVCQAKGVLSAYRMMTPEDTEEWKRTHCEDCGVLLKHPMSSYGICDRCWEKAEEQDRLNRAAQ